MAETGAKGTMSMGKVLGIAIVVSALVGGAVGYVTGSLRGPPQPPQTREFWMFTVVLPFNETAEIPSHDYFAPDRITVYKGDTVLIHFFNTEDVPEDHTFTMAAPYERNVNVPFQQTVDISFVAGTTGIFSFWCAYHQPTMRGWLVVLSG